MNQILKTRGGAIGVQGQLLNERQLWKQTIEDKINGLTQTVSFKNFWRCGREPMIKTCLECKGQEMFNYHCSLKWCPLCNWKITKQRQEVIGRWAREVNQPKHLILTQRNSASLTGSMLKSHTKNLSRLRRSEIFGSVNGGCVSTEITNESKGWHLHSHWLIDSRWVDAQELSRTWGRLVGQEFAIVKVIDLRGEGQRYVQEVSKYVCKGSEMARWPATEILQFINAIRGRRMFFVFGELFRKGAAIRREIAQAKSHSGSQCECGCNRFIVRGEEQQVVRDHNRAKGRRG